MPLNKSSLTYTPPGMTPPANMYNYSAPSGDSSEFQEYSPGRKAPITQHQVSSSTPLTPQQVRAFLQERNVAKPAAIGQKSSPSREVTAPPAARPSPKRAGMTNPVPRKRRATQI